MQMRQQPEHLAVQCDPLLGQDLRGGTQTEIRVFGEKILHHRFVLGGQQAAGGINQTPARPQQRPA